MGQPSRSDAADDSHVCGWVHHRGRVQGLRSLVYNEHHQGPGSDHLHCVDQETYVHIWFANDKYV